MLLPLVLKKYWTLFPEIYIILFLLCLLVYGLWFVPKIRYYYSYVVLLSTAVLSGLIYFPILVVLGRSPANTRLTRPAAALCSKLVGIEWEIRGSDILSEDRAAIVIVNHQTDFDLVGTTYISHLLRRVMLISKSTLMYFVPYSILLWFCGTIYINQSKGKDASDVVIETANQLVKQKDKLLIFPEGRLNPSGEKLCQFKHGAFRAAIESKVLIIPVVISPFYFMNVKKKEFHGGHMIIKALDPINTDGLKIENVDELKDSAWKIMQEEYNKLREEVHEKYLSNNME